MSEGTAFERDTTLRLLTLGARHWIVSHVLATGELPPTETYFAYPESHSIDWGAKDILRGKRVRINLIIEDFR